MAKKIAPAKVTTVEEWTMPEWMEKYRPTFRFTKGNSIEDIMRLNTIQNCETQEQENRVIIAVSSQVNLLMDLHKQGMIQ